MARSRRGQRPAPIELLYGLHPVREALRAQRRPLRKLWVQEGLRGVEREALVAGMEGAGVEVALLPRQALDLRLPPGARSQGVLLEAGPLPEPSLESLARGAGCLVALDGVEDPQNLGAIIRVAETAGAAGLLLTRRRAPPLSGAVARASAGAVEHLPITRVGNLRDAINHLKNKGFWIFGSDAHEGRDLFSLPDRLLCGRQVFLFGAEGRGLRPGIRELVDHPIQIPLRGEVGSLNVASAAAVVLFEMVRRSR